MFRRAFPVSLLASLALWLAPAPGQGQQFPADDPILRRIWAQGMDSSQTFRLAQVLLDSLGPRLTGTPEWKAANDWLVRTYASWGIAARQEPYGTWKSWRRGVSHIDLLTPRVRTLEGGTLAWSPGTGGRDVTGSVILLPQVADRAAFEAWLPQARGKFVLLSFPEPTCRPDEYFQARAQPQTFLQLQSSRLAARRAWLARVEATGFSTGLGAGTLGQRLGEAGAAGVITSYWAGGWGTRPVFGDLRQVVPALELSCEDYGLVFRLAEHDQAPTIRVRSDAEMLGDAPAANTIATMRGSESPDEYVILSAHFDSWDAGSGATDNGTGTLVMLEAMRILKTVYPNPKRTIIAGHWSGEEQGLNGSRAWAEDNPRIVAGLQALFNQDDGTGRIERIDAGGFLDAGGALARWLARIPPQLSSRVRLAIPGTPAGDGTDNASFICHGAPGFGTGASDWDYNTYTWHTNRDTFDKIVFDDLKNNATLFAMLAYLASEDPELVARTRRTFARGESGAGRSAGPGGTPGAARGITAWPACTPAIREPSGYRR